MTALVEITTTLPDAVALDAIPPLDGYTVQTVAVGTPGPDVDPALLAAAVDGAIDALDLPGTYGLLPRTGTRAVGQDELFVNVLDHGVVTGTNTAAALRTLFASATPNTTYYFPAGLYILSSAAAGVIAALTALDGVTLQGAGQGTILRMQAVTATDGLRFDGCRSFTMRDFSVQVTNAATVTNAIQFTCPISGGAHNPSFERVYVTNPSQSYRQVYDGSTVSGSPVVTSASAAFAGGDVGGGVGCDQQGEILTGLILSVATRTAAVSNSGTPLTSSQTTIPLAAPITNAPNNPYTIVIGSEYMLVTGGFQTSTLTVVRGVYDLSTAATHADGSTVTTYQATLDTNAITTTTGLRCFNVQTPASSIMTNGIAVGSDHASGALDIPQVKFVGVQVEGALGCGWRLGGGVSGNILDVSMVSSTAAASGIGVFINGAGMNWHGPSIGHNAVDFKLGAPTSQPVVVHGVRSEVSGVLWEAEGAGTSAGVTVALRDCTIVSFGAADGVPIRHNLTASLSLENITLTRPVAAQTVVISAGNTTNSPLYYRAHNVISNGGNSNLHPPASTGIVRVITNGPRLFDLSDVGVKSLHGNSFDALMTLKTVAMSRVAQTLASSGAVTIDASAGDAVITLQANAASSSITNPTTDQILRITWIQDATGGRAYPWPANCVFIDGNVPADTTANKRTTVTFRYDGTNWNEMSRAGENDTRTTGKAPLASPALTGTPTAPTPAAADNSTKVATTAFVAAAVANPAALTTGEVVPPRDQIISQNVGTATGVVYLTYFTADKSETISTLTVNTGTTAAAATPTICRMGLFTVDGSGNLTLVASTPNDATLFAAANTLYAKALSVAYAKVQGQRYATGLIVVTAAAAPTFNGKQMVASNWLNTLNLLPPAIAGRLAAQTDLPSSIAVGGIVGYQGQIAMRLS